MAAVFDAEGLPKRVVSTALALAFHADADGGSIRPGIATVAAYARSDRRNVQRYIRELEQIGVLAVVRRGGAGARCCTEYRLRLDRLAELDGKGGRRTALQPNAESGADTALDESAKGGASTSGSSTSGWKGGTESGADTARSGKGNEERARVRVGTGETDWSAVWDRRRRELQSLEVEYTKAGFRTALGHETPGSYRTAFEDWQRRHRGPAPAAAASRHP